jgi:integrase/recombinase XerC
LPRPTPASSPPRERPAGAAPAPQPLAGYLDHLASERRLSRHTVLNYARDIGALLALAGDTPLERLDVHQVRRFVARLHAQGLGGRSLARMLSAWRGFFRYLARDHGLAVNPCAGLRAPKSPRRLPHALSPDEANRLLAIEGGDDDALRDRAVLELFYSSGLRLAELAALAPGDVDYREGMVRVTGKGGKTRVVPVGRHALEALRAWLAVRGRIAAADPAALFVNARGRRLQPRAIQLRIKRRAAAQGLSSNVHPHVLRHSFASHVLQSSGDLRAVQDMLGHASIATTQVYTQLDFQHLAKVYDAAHPRARKKR